MKRLILLIFCIMTLTGLSSFVLGVGAYPWASNPLDAINYWTFNESTNAEIIDYINGTNLSTTVTATSESGQVATSIRYSTGKSINEARAIASIKDATICVWINRTNAVGNKKPITFYVDDSNYIGFGVSDEGGSTWHFRPFSNFGGATYAATMSTATLSSGVWFHTCIGLDGKLVHIYMDGVYDNSQTFPFSFENLSSPMAYVGIHTKLDAWTTNPHNLDELIIFAGNLTSNQIWNIYNGNVSAGGTPTTTNINCTSCNPPQGDTSSPYTTSDTTPTFSIDTDINANCRIDDDNQDYTAMGSTRNCNPTGAKSHICTLKVTDELLSSTDYAYISCANGNNDTLSNTTELQMNITQLEINSSKAIEEGINSSDIYPATAIYRDQQIYIRSLNNTQRLATVDRVAVKGDKRWLLNYVIDSGSLLGLFNITPAVYVWDTTDLAMNTIRNEVSSLINSTYP